MRCRNTWKEEKPLTYIYYVYIVTISKKRQLGLKYKRNHTAGKYNITDKRGQDTRLFYIIMDTSIGAITEYDAIKE